MNKTLIASLMGASLILAGCQTAAPTETTVPDQTQAQTTAQAQTAADTKAPAAGTSSPVREKLTFGNYTERITFDLASALTLWEEEYPGAMISSIELDHSDDSWHYLIEGIADKDEMTLTIDALSGEVIKGEAANADDDDEVLDFVSIIALDDALEEAQAETFVDAGIEGWKLDWDNEAIWYSFDLEEADLKVNAEDRSVIVD